MSNASGRSWQGASSQQQQAPASSETTSATGQRYWQQQVPGLSPVYVRRPRAIVFDILGTASKSGFLERILFPYLRINLEPYVNTHWSRKDFIKLYKRIQEHSVDLHKSDPLCPVVPDHEQQDAKSQLLAFINHVTDNGLASAPVTQLRFKVWFEGYQSSRLRTPIYSDVPNRIRVWYAEGVKFHVFSNTWVEAQRALLRNTNHGDLTNLITSHFDNDFGLLTSTDSWRRLCHQIGEQPNDVLFLTKSPLEASAAQEAGVTVVLVLTHRHNVRAVSHEDRQRFPYVRTLNDLQWIDGPITMAPSSTPTHRSSLPEGASASGRVGPPSQQQPMSIGQQMMPTQPSVPTSRTSTSARHSSSATQAAATDPSAPSSASYQPSH